ncbi:cytochrome P450 [Zychaea mexicana]|uniref:cytochrome P450 n=1 Tax=Zychaea mexicana TaxID=64656 RepID=UPI0022FDED5A|nr:cytochrome P450 [Zychaea mexicana]KAI9470411.1 cytochrome P450 [Zychaea mexicana]
MIGSTLEYRQNPQEFVEKWSAALGPVFRVHIFGRMQTVISGSYVREIFFNENFSFATAVARPQMLTGMSKYDVDTDDLREVVLNSLTVRMKDYVPRAMAQLGIGLEETLGDLAEPRELPHLFPPVLHMVARASASVFVGLDLCQDQEVLGAFKYIDNILQDIIENHPPPPSYPGNCYTYFTNWVIALIFASVATTTEHGALVLYRMLQHPEIVDELVQEQKDVFGEDILNSKDNNVFTGESLRKLVKLVSVCREAIRMRNEYLTLPHTNIGKQSFTLSNGVVIPPGQEVLLDVWANHHDSRLQRDNLGNYDKFEPFRHLEIGRSSTKIGDDYLVFGEGKHACPGRWFALQEIKTVVTLFIRDYILKPNGSIEFPTGAGTRVPTGKVTIQRKA